MAVSTATAAWRVRIATAGASTVAGNVDVTLYFADLGETTEVVDAPLLAGAKVDVLKANAVSRPVRFSALTDDVLTTSNGRYNLLGRLADVSRALDGGAYSVQALGRITHASEPDDRGRIDCEIGGALFVERRARLFLTTDSIQLHPPGRAEAFMGFAPAGSDTYVVLEVSGNAVRIESTRIGTATLSYRVPRALRDALREDLVDAADLDKSATNSAGNFDSLRFDLDSGGPTPGDYRVISFSTNLGGLTNASTVLGDLKPAGEGRVTTAWIYFGSGHGLAADDEIVGRFYFPGGILASEKVPVLIGGASGVHPMTLLKDILDGDYGGEAVSYDSAAMAVLEALPFAPVWARVSGPVARTEWLRESVYKPFGIAPLVGDDLSLVPTQWTLPQNVSIGGLSTISASEGGSLRWYHPSSRAVTTMDMTYRQIDELPEGDDSDDRVVDGLQHVDKALAPVEHDTVSTLGEIPYSIKTELSFSPDLDIARAREILYTRARAIFAVCGDGPGEGAIRVPENSGHATGDLVLLDQDTLKGFNAETGDRSGDRLVRLLGFSQPDPASLDFDFLEMGPGSSALAAPSVTITQNGTDADVVDVAVSGVPSGATAVVQVATGATTPSDYPFERSNVGNETIQFRVGAGSGNAYARVKAVRPGRIESAWATDSVALSARARIVRAKIRRTTLTSFAVEWEVEAGTGGMRADWSVHSRTAPPSFGSNEDDYDATDGGFEVTGSLSSTREAISVRLTPYPTFSAGSVSGTPGDAWEDSVWLVTLGIPWVFRGIPPVVQVSFDATGDVVATVHGDEEAAEVYVTVGDGSSPSDPTAGSNDGTFSGRRGTISTGVTPSADNDVYVKAVAADLAGRLGPVSETIVAAEARGKVIRIDSSQFIINSEQWTDVSWAPKYLSPTGTFTRTLFAAVVLPVGAVVTQVRFRIYKTNASDSFVGYFYRVDEDLTTGVTNVGSQSDGGGTGHEWVTIGSLSEEVTSGRVYKLQAVMSNNAAAGDCRLGFAEISYTIPGVGSTV